MIQVRAPDGSIAQFPDGTGDAQIQTVMARHFGGPSGSQMRANADAQVRAGNTPGLVRAMNNGLLFNLAGPADAAGAALETGVHNAVAHATGQKDSGYGMAQAFDAVRNAEAGAQARYGADHPVLNALGTLVGAVANPVNRAAGRYVAGAGSLPAGIARSVATSAPIGAAYGAGGAPDGQHAAGAASGAALGALMSAGLPVAGAMLGPVLRRGGQTAINALQGVKNIGRDAGAPATAAEQALAQSKVLQMMKASKTTPGALASHPAVASGKPVTTAEAIGRQGITNLAALARRSGPTGDALQATLADRMAMAPQRLQQDFASAAGIHPEAASGDIDGLIGKLQVQAKPLYDAALSHPDPVWNPDLAKLAQRPVVRKAIAQVGADMQNAGKDPTAAGLKLDPDTGLHVLNPDLSNALEQQPTAQTWDAVKKAIGRQIERNPVSGRPLPDSQSSGNYGVRAASQDLTGALAGDPGNGVPGAIPGYRAALDKAGDYLRLQDAFDKGSKLITSPSVDETDFGSVYSGLDDASQQAFLGGFANKLYDMAQNGRLNANVFKAPRVQQKIATVLGPDNANSFLQNVQLEGHMAQAGSRMMPGNGSPTMELTNAAAEQEGGPNVLSILHAAHNPLGAIGSLIDAGKAVGTSPQVRGEIGRILMQPPSASVSELGALPMPETPPLLGASAYPALIPTTQQLER